MNIEPHIKKRLERDYKLMEEFLSRYPKDSVKNLEIIDLITNPRPTIWISGHRPKYFVPNISRRAANWEDNTIPRIYTSWNLAMCIHMSGMVLSPYLTNKLEKTKDGFSGIWYIHGQRDLLVLSAKDSFRRKIAKEHGAGVYEEYIVAYKPELVTVTPEPMGSFFISEVTSLFRAHRYPEKIATIYLEVLSQDGLALQNTTHVEKGYYLIKASYKSDTDAGSMAPYTFCPNLQSKSAQITPISKSQFTANRKLCTAMEAFVAIHAPKEKPGKSTNFLQW